MVKRGEMPLSKFKDREQKRRAVRLENKVLKKREEVMPMNREVYYQDNRVALYNADCSDILKGLADQSIDLLVTDPPYG